MAYHLWLHTQEAHQCPSSIAAFTPDRLLYDHRSKRVILYEFSRCMGTKPCDLDQRHTEKAQAYHEQRLRLYLLLLLPEYSVELVTFVMTISGSIPVTMWDTNFSLLGVGEPQRKPILQETIVHAIQGLHEFVRVWKSRIPNGLAVTVDDIS
eukprot:3082654-Rhodomonas_salina.1